jgi:calcium/calmodulin-dependent protein kinase I
MWSIGVITYCLLASYPPFNADTDVKLYRKIQLCDYEFHPDVWDSISSDAKKFVMGLLQPVPELRLKPLDALNHPWILQHTSGFTFENQHLE